jgi:kynureninase
MQFNTDLSLAHQLDAQDVLSPFRDRFVITDPDLIYLDGNSLGRLPKATVEYMQQAIEVDWGERLIRLWNDGWVHTPNELGARIARLIGAQPDEVLVCEATSTNLFKPSRDSITIHPEDLASSLDANTALLSLTHVAFKSAFMYDMELVTGLAHHVGALTLWDLSHSVGAVPLQLNAWEVDLAVGCTYKYLNGGPGAPAFLYVRKDLQNQLMPPAWGWFASQSPFNFELDFIPAGDISRFRIGTPPMLSMKAIEPALDIHLEAGIDRLRVKSTHQTDYLIYLASEWLLPLGFSLGSPLDPAQRGSHISLRHPEAYRINRAMIESPPPAVRVIPDFRTPDNIRLGIAPLYTTFTDIYRAMDRMHVIVSEKVYEHYSEDRLEVT